MGGTGIELSQGQIPVNTVVCEDTPSNRAFLTNFLLMLAGIPEEDSTSQDQASRAVDMIMAERKERRTLNGVWELVLESNSALRKGLKRWINLGAFAGWFNGTIDPTALGVKSNEDVTSFLNSRIAYDALDLNASRLVSFEMTDVQKTPASAAAMTTYIMHRIRSLVREHASPHLLFIDETAPMLEDPIFCTSVKTLLRERSEEHTSELQSLMRISYAVFCLKKKKENNKMHTTTEKT